MMLRAMDVMQLPSHPEMFLLTTVASSGHLSSTECSTSTQTVTFCSLLLSKSAPPSVLDSDVNLTSFYPELPFLLSENHVASLCLNHMYLWGM